LTIHVTMALALVSTSIAMRDQNPNDIKSLISDRGVTICGNDQIWSTITSPSTARAIKAINWKSIDDIIVDYLGDHESLGKRYQGEISRLKEVIEKKKKKGVSRAITQEEVENLVDQSVKHEDAFGSKLAAEETACGKPGKRYQGEKPNPEGFANSQDVMQEAAEEFFSTGLVESEVKFFTRKCEDYLGFVRSDDKEADDLASYCDELCAELAQIAQAVSNNKGAGAKGDLRALERELDKAEGKKQELTDQKTLCEDAKTKIDQFHGYMEKLLRVMTEKHGAFQTAEWALFDAMEALKEMTANLLAQQQLVQKATSGLTDLGVAASAAKEEMETADAQMADATTALTKATDEWEALTADMEAVKVAEKYADEVKERLSLLLMKMDGYVEECVREPVRNIGLSEDTKVYEGEFFTWDVKTLPAKQDMNDALSAFHQYCEGTATDIFEQVKDKVDLSPLCDLQPQDVSLNEIVDTVQKRKDSVVEAIQDVQSWLDPFKGLQGVTKATEQSEYVDAGEPLGLRRVMSMQLETFYSSYLQKWKRNGEFLALLASITEAINDLDLKVTKAAQNMDKAAKDLQTTQGLLENAVVAYNQAQANADLEKQDLTETMTTLEGEVAKAKLNLDDLKKKVEAARLAWGMSKTLLLKQHAATRESLVEQHAGMNKLE